MHFELTALLSIPEYILLITQIIALSFPALLFSHYVNFIQDVEICRAVTFCACTLHGRICEET